MKIYLYIIKGLTITVAVFLLFVSTNVFAQTYTFNSDLSVGSTGEEVLFLQRVLNTDPTTQVSDQGAGSPGNESNYFGVKTRLAVVKFQEKYASEILAPLNLSFGTGVVGARTRAVLNGLSGGSVVGTVAEPGSLWEKSTAYPVITSVTPLEVSDPRQIPVVISGENFLPSNTVFLSLQDLEMFSGKSTDGKTITLFLNTAYIDIVKDLMNSVPQTPDGSARQSAINSLKTEFNSVGKDGVYVPAVIFVKNENGESNKFQISINVLKDAQ